MKYIRRIKEKQKRLFLIAILTFMSIVAHAFTVNGINYSILSNTTVSVVSKSPKYTGDVVIPNRITYNGVEYNVTTIGSSAFYNCYGLTSLTLPEGLTSIDSYAFYNCNGLTSLTLPASLTSIGSSAFKSCSGLTSLTLPASLTSIGSSAFSNCSGLTSITLPKSLTSIGSSAFEDCSSLTSITIPQNVAQIGTNAFARCNNLSSIVVDENNEFYDSRKNCNAIIETANNKLLIGCSESIIPDDVKEIGSSAFSYCDGLTSITIPEGVTTIGSSAFRYCSGLTSITILDSLTNISRYAFHNTKWYETSDDGVVYINSHLYAYKGEMPANTQIEIQNGTTSITEYAFYNCDNLTSVTIPDGVFNIGSYAFKGCDNLDSVAIPGSVKNVGEDAFFGTSWYNAIDNGALYMGSVLYEYRGVMPANTHIDVREGTKCISDNVFYGKTELTSISLPQSVEHIGNSAFYECRNLSDITLPDSATYIGSYAFYNCSGLTSIVIPEGVTTIGSSAFWSCSGLTSLTLPASLTSIGSSAFSNCSGLTSLAIPEGVTTIGSSAFSNCSGLTSLTLPESLTSIGSSAFSNCRGLTSLTLPESLASIGSNAFGYCRGLTSLTLPASLTSIGSYAFWYCSGLTSIVIPEGVTTIGDDAFAYCSGLTSLTLPASLTSIGSSVFYGCSNIETVICGKCVVDKGMRNTFSSSYSKISSVTLFDDVTSIPDRTFDSWSKLSSITFPDSILSIGNSAFNRCIGLISISLPETLKSIGESAFYNCSSLATIDIPEEIDYVGSNAFYGTPWLESLDDGVVYMGSSLYCYKGTMPSGTSITVKDGTRNICGNAFKGCRNLVSLAIPEGVTTIGSSAFQSCSGLTSITLPEGLTSIGSSAFSGCYGLTSIAIPEGVTTIGSSAFWSCNGLTSITLPESLDSIGDYAFGYCSGLTCIAIPEGVTTIGSSAFYNCRGLTSISLPESLTSIGSNTFYDCSGLTSIAIPQNVEQIGTNAFARCNNLSSIVVDENNEFYDSRKNCNAIIETANNKLLIGCSGSIIPDDVKEIGDYAFYYCIFDSIALPSQIVSIGNYAFNRCQRLVSLTIPESVRSIGENAFYDCYSLTDVSVPKNTESIGYCAFHATPWYDSLEDGLIYIGSVLYAYKGEMPADTHIEMRNDIKSISPRAFSYSDCRESLTSITLSDSLVSIGEGAFYNCLGLNYIAVPQTVTSIENDAFYRCNNLQTVFNSSQLPLRENSSGYGYIAYYAMKVLNVNDLERIDDFFFSTSGYDEHYLVHYNGKEDTISLPEDYNGQSYMIDKYAFYNCDSLESVTIPKNVYDIADFAFANCNNLSAIMVDKDNANYDSRDNCNAIIESSSNSLLFGCKTTIVPQGVKSIGDGAFQGCSGLTSLSLPSSVKTIGNNAFENCSNLKSITMPTTLTNIGSNAFYDCDSLTYITLPEDLTGMGSYAFYDCGSLASISIPKGLTTIGYSTFYGCESLRCVELPESLTSIGSYAFEYCNRLDSINFPKNLTSIGSYAFYGCNSLDSISFSENLKSIEYGAFSYCENLSSIRCYATDPPSASSAFYGIDKNNVVVRVYSHAVPSYQKNTGWVGMTIIPMAFISEAEWKLLGGMQNHLTSNGNAEMWDMSADLENIGYLNGVDEYRGHVVGINLSKKKLEGDFPEEILDLPYLETINLRENNLSGDLPTIIKEKITEISTEYPDSILRIKSIDVSGNHLTGNVGKLASLSQLANLDTFIGDNNMFDELTPELPYITSLSLKEQEIDKEIEIDFNNTEVESIVAQIPSLLLYDHKNQTHQTQPSILLANYPPNTEDYSAEKPYFGAKITMNNGVFSFEKVKDNTYKGTSGDTLFVSNMDAEDEVLNSFCYMVHEFEQGDADFINGVTVADLQATILYAFEEYKRLFNFTAANTYVDSIINVQDAVCTVNILLADNETDRKYSAFVNRHNENEQMQNDACIYIKDNQVFLNTSKPIAAISIKADGNIRWVLDKRGMMQAVSGSNVVAYSLEDVTIPVGVTLLGYCDSEAVIQSISLSDADAKEIPVYIGDNIETSIEKMIMDNDEVEIYTIQGVRVDALQPGINIIKINGKTIKYINNNL